MINVWCYRIKLKVQDRQVDFYVTKYEKSVNMVSDATMKLIFMKLPHAKCWCSIKVEHTQFSGRAF